MRPALILVLTVAFAGAHAQRDIWKDVSAEPNAQQLESITPSGAQLKAIAALLNRDHSKNMWDCEANEREEMIKGLTYEAVPVGKDKQVLLAEAPAGCGRGGQGANGAMWLIEFNGDSPIIIASPKGGFDGWLYSIQAEVSHGLHDIVLGWHMGAGNTGLAYFRFNGKSYEAIGSATNHDGTIEPNTK